MRFELIIFDVDGTLLDPIEGVARSVKCTTNVMGWEEIPINVIHSFIGPPIRESFKKYYRLSDDLADMATEIFRTRYKDEDMYYSKLYDGVSNLLKALKEQNSVLAIATYKRHDYAVELIEHFKLSPYFSYIHGSDNYKKKTKLDIVNQCIKDANLISLSDAVLVGDTESDAIGAGEAGIKFIGVTYGFGFRTEKDVSSYPHVGYADNLKQLEDLLLT